MTWIRMKMQAKRSPPGVRITPSWLTSRSSKVWQSLVDYQLSKDLDSSNVVILMHMGSCAGQERISAEILSQWCLEAKQHASLRAMRKLMKVSCLLSEDPAFQALPSSFTTLSSCSLS